MQIFKNEDFGEIRILQLNGEPYFVGKPIAEVLGYSNRRDTIAKHIDDEDKGVAKCDTLGGIQEVTVINESGLYSLILSSKLPTAKKFKRWVTSEVLPTIRKTGGYVSNEDTFINTYLQFADEQTKLLFKATLNTVKQLNSKIEKDKPKVIFADAVDASHNSILVGDLAKLIKQNGVDIGRKRLFEWLRNNGYLQKHGESRNMPTQKAMELQLFEVKERTVAAPDGSIRITKTTKVTGKGQVYFVNKFIGMATA